LVTIRVLKINWTEAVNAITDDYGEFDLADMDIMIRDRGGWIKAQLSEIDGTIFLGLFKGAGVKVRRKAPLTAILNLIRQKKQEQGAGTDLLVGVRKRKIAPEDSSTSQLHDRSTVDQ
jgi:hypothetical protein